MIEQLTIAEFNRAKKEMENDIYSAINVAMWKFYEKTGVNSKGEIYFKWDVAYSEQGEEIYRQPEIDIELKKNIVIWDLTYAN